MAITIANENARGSCPEFRGLSTDTKPTDCANGSIFIEIDTGSIYMFDAAGGTWHQI